MLKEEQFRDEAGLMLLRAGVLQPITRGKGTKRDQAFLAQHNELGMGTEMFMAPALRQPESSSLTADVGQEHGECSASSVPSTPPQPHFVFPAVEFPVEQGKRCLRVLSVSAQNQMRG